jgi:KaiC/GvpD/RAD55 family RecA-like ATPase
MVGQFLAAGLRAGDRLLVIATEAHRQRFLRQLERDLTA